jgi:hypothetical protein
MFDLISLALHPPRFVKRGIRLHPRRHERPEPLARSRIDSTAIVDDVDDESRPFARPEEAA